MKFNGTTKLLALFNHNESNFIEHFIKSCYFVSKKSVENRTNFILDEINKKNKLPIRYTANMKGKFISENKYLKNKTKKQINELVLSDNFKFKDINNENVSVFLDPTGNQALVNAIEIETGHLISTTNCNFINYTISHIWENTTHNPYFFSSLWNITIIPNYLNYLMDKPKRQDKLNEEVQEIMKALCFQIYKDSISKMQHKIQIKPPNKKYINIADKAIKEKWVTFLDNNTEKNNILFLNADLEKISTLKNNEFIFQALNFMKKNLLFEENLANLTDRARCLELFGHYRPILILDKNKIFENGSRRYYEESIEINNQKYFVTNDWYKKSEKNKRDNRNIFINWIYELLNK